MVSNLNRENFSLGLQVAGVSEEIPVHQGESSSTHVPSWPMRRSHQIPDESMGGRDPARKLTAAHHDRPPFFQGRAKGDMRGTEKIESIVERVDDKLQAAAQPHPLELLALPREVVNKDRAMFRGRDNSTNGGSLSAGESGDMRTGFEMILAQGQTLRADFNELSNSLKSTTQQRVNVESTLAVLQAQLTEVYRYVQDDARWGQLLGNRESQCASEDRVAELLNKQFDDQYRRMEELLGKTLGNNSACRYHEPEFQSQPLSESQECTSSKAIERPRRFSKRDQLHAMVNQALLTSDVAFQNYKERMAKHAPSIRDLVQTLGWAPSVVKRSSISQARMRFRQVNEFVLSFQFASFVGFLVLLNSLFIAVQTNQHLRRSIGKYYYNSNQSKPSWFIVVDATFCTVFSIEIVVRVIAAEGITFFIGEERWWNILDLFLVILAIVELAVDNITLQLTFMRMLRALRAVRILRIVKAVSYLHPLRVMLMSIIHSFVSLLWSFVFLGGVIFIFSVIFCQVVANYIDNAGPNDQSHVDTLRQHFPSIEVAMMTLFMCSSGGREWSAVYEALRRPGEFWSWVFVFYIAFITIGVYNVIVGMFVEAAAKCAQTEREMAMTTVMVKKGSPMNILKTMLQGASANGGEYITGTECATFFETAEAHRIFRLSHIDADEARGLFSMLNASSDAVLIDEFIVGLTVLQGGNGIHFANQWFQTRQLTAQIGNFMQYTREHFLFIEQVLQQSLSKSDVNV